MSFFLTNHSMKLDSKPLRPHKLFLIYLAYRARCPDGLMWRSQVTMAKESGLSLATVKRHLNWLVEHGYVHRKHINKVSVGGRTIKHWTYVVLPYVQHKIDQENGPVEDSGSSN